MTAKQLWDEFVNQNDAVNNTYESWAFGDNPDLLVSLVLSGEKTATASAYALYELENEPIPEIGSYSVILDSKDEAKCIIQTTKVYVEEFSKVSKEHAYKEGEGDKSLDYWRKVHQEFFTKCLKEADLEFDETMKVVCEEFKVVYKRGD